MGKPKEPQGYEEIQVDDLSIYVQKSLNFKDNEIILKLSGFSIFKSISAEELSRFK